MDGAQLLAAFYAGLSQAEKEALQHAVTNAGAALFLVGGPVRDLVLGRPGLDMDIAVEGELDGLSASLRHAGYRVVEHGRFGTATLRGQGFTIDFARTRRETYERPGALPDVEPAGIEEDLARRDFTVNAMAMRITPPAGQVIDPFAGMRDVEGQILRVLHRRSFVDDATRMLRACRYAARLGFHLEPGTAALLQRDLGYIGTVSGARIRRELELAFAEPSAIHATGLMRNLRILPAIHPLLVLSRSDGARWRDGLLGEHYASVVELGFCMVSACRTEADVAALSERLHLTGRLERVLSDLVRLPGLASKLEQPGTTAAEVVAELERFAPAAVWAFALGSSGWVRDRCLNYLERWRRVRPHLDGFDLQAMGLAAGPEVGRALARLREARLLGEVDTKDGEVALVRAEFSGGGSR